MKNYKIIIFILVIVVLILQLFTAKSNSNTKNDTLKATVALSTFSLYDIATHIAQDSVDIFMIIPFGVEPHSFEPTPRLMVNIQKSDLVIYSGAGLEPWTNNFEFKSNTIDMSKNVKLLKIKHHHHEDGKELEEHHHMNGIDPHYWLDFDNMKIATKIITDELIKLIPENKNLYLTNQQKYLKMLDSLDKKYKKSLLKCTKNTIIVNHNAFSYLANRYNFKVEALSGLSPEAQPSAKVMVKLIEDVKEHNLSSVFFESFVSDKAIKSIAKEAHVRAESLQPLGNITADEALKHLDYETMMLDNLEKISKALECK